jgi:hypothetical protein
MLRFSPSAPVQKFKHCFQAYTHFRCWLTGHTNIRHVAIKSPGIFPCGYLDTSLILMHIRNTVVLSTGLEGSSKFTEICGEGSHSNDLTRRYIQVTHVLGK